METEPPVVAAAPAENGNGPHHTSSSPVKEAAPEPVLGFKSIQEEPKAVPEEKKPEVEKGRNSLDIFSSKNLSQKLSRHILKFEISFIL